jgi:uncharacterized membrane protein (DUF485 family)
MSIIDRQRIATVRALEGMGYVFTGGEWQRRGTFTATALREADAMHALLVHRADALEGCVEGSDEERELAALVAIRTLLAPALIVIVLVVFTTLTFLAARLLTDLLGHPLPGIVLMAWVVTTLAAVMLVRQLPHLLER